MPIKQCVACVAALCLLAMLLPAGAGASAPTAVQITQTVQADDVLHVYFDVTDEAGEPVSDLDAGEISLMLGASEMDVSVGSAADVPIGYIFAVDISKSLSDKQFEGVRSAMADWIANLGEGDAAAIVTFGEAISIVLDFTDDTDALIQACDELRPTDQRTQLYNGMLTTLDLAKRQSADLPLRRGIVVLSDGMDDYAAGATVAEVTQRVRDGGIPLYVVGVQSRNNQSELNELGGIARLSGGDLYPAQSDALSSGYEEILARIRGGYAVTAALDASVANGALSGLLLAVTRNGMTIEASRDVRLRAVSLAPTIEAEATPAAALTPAPTTAAPDTSASTTRVRQALPRWLILVLLVIACLGAAAAVVIVVVLSAAKKKRTLKNAPPPITPRDAEEELNRRITLRDGSEPETVMDNDTRFLNEDMGKTEMLGDIAAQLTLTLEDHASGRSYSAPLGREMTVGRIAGNIIVVDDQAVSATHCVFIQENDALYLEDRGSSNGTFLIDAQGKRRLAGRERVRHGDVISIGRLELRIRLEK